MSNTFDADHDRNNDPYNKNSTIKKLNKRPKNWIREAIIDSKSTKNWIQDGMSPSTDGSIIGHKSRGVMIMQTSTDKNKFSY